jgi:hypothetical protein
VAHRALQIIALLAARLAAGSGSTGTTASDPGSTGSGGSRDGRKSGTACASGRRAGASASSAGCGGSSQIISSSGSSGSSSGTTTSSSSSGGTPEESTSGGSNTAAPAAVAGNSLPAPNQLAAADGTLGPAEADGRLALEFWVGMLLEKALVPTLLPVLVQHQSCIGGMLRRACEGAAELGAMAATDERGAQAPSRGVAGNMACERRAEAGQPSDGGEGSGRGGSRELPLPLLPVVRRWLRALLPGGVLGQMAAEWQEEVEGLLGQLPDAEGEDDAACSSLGGGEGVAPSAGGAAAGGGNGEGQRHCHTCDGVLEEPVMLCGGCRRMWYCSQQCQTADWKRHRRQCTQWRAAAAAGATAVHAAGVIAVGYGDSG